MNISSCLHLNTSYHVTSVHKFVFFRNKPDKDCYWPIEMLYTLALFLRCLTSLCSSLFEFNFICLFFSTDYDLVWSKVEQHWSFIKSKILTHTVITLNSTFNFFDWLRPCLIQSWARLIVHDFCSGFQALMYVKIIMFHHHHHLYHHIHSPKVMIATFQVKTP